VVRATGGLADSITDLDAEPTRGNGFTFDDCNAAALVRAVRRALRHYEDAATWTRWVRRAMREDFSWKRSASAYVSIYEKTITP
jgi:starch synthase